MSLPEVTQAVTQALYSQMATDCNQVLLVENLPHIHDSEKQIVNEIVQMFDF